MVKKKLTLTSSLWRCSLHNVDYCPEHPCTCALTRDSKACIRHSALSPREFVLFGYERERLREIVFAANVSLVEWVNFSS